MNRYLIILLLTAFLLLITLPVFSFESGMASWYGGKFQGRKTANGEFFDTNKLTAAHKTLPFNTVVEVTNIKNNQTVTVRINDRGPFIEGRVIDLSRAAADEIDMTKTGIAHVELKIISLPEGFQESGLIKTKEVNPVGIPENYKIQIASFSRAENAQNCLAKIRNGGIDAAIEVSEAGMLRVIIPVVKKDEIEHLKALLGAIGFKSPLVRHN